MAMRERFMAAKLTAPTRIAGKRHADVFPHPFKVVAVRRMVPVRWFGQSWGASVCDPVDHVETPAGENCTRCGEQLQATDTGVILPYASDPPASMPYHRNCYLREIIGSVGHQNGNCSCRDGGGGDPPGMTLREAADAAVTLFYTKETPAL
jgi:hypothetical protein